MKTERKFPKYFRELLEKHQITQKELSEKSGLHETYISQICNGRRYPNFTHLLKISEVLATEEESLIEIYLELSLQMREDIKRGGMST